MGTWPGLTNLHVAEHLRVERAMVLDVAGLTEGDEELRPGVLRAGSDGGIVRRHRVRRGAVLKVPFDGLPGGNGDGRRIELADRVRIGHDLHNRVTRPGGRATGRGATPTTAAASRPWSRHKRRTAARSRRRRSPFSKRSR